MQEDYENKPISLLTDDERIKDAENQRELLKEMVEAGWQSNCVCIFERMDYNFSSTEPVRAIMTFTTSNDDKIGAIQVSNPYLGTYQQRFYRGLGKSYWCYHYMKEVIASFPTAKLIWEGRMNSNVKLS